MAVVPVPLSKKLHAGGYEDTTHQGCIEQDCYGKPESGLLGDNHFTGGEAAKHGDHDERYAGHIMGIPETILFKAEQDDLELFEIGNMCEPPPGEESVAMAHSLINSAPLVAGIDKPQERQALADHVFHVSRALIGPKLADELAFPKSRVFGVLPWFRTELRLQRLWDAGSPGLAGRTISRSSPDSSRPQIWRSPKSAIRRRITSTRKSPRAGRGNALNPLLGERGHLQRPPPP